MFVSAFPTQRTSGYLDSLLSWHSHHSDKIGKAFYLQGYGVEWDGAEYVRHSLRRLIPKFQGTKNINELMCSVLTDEKKILLQARGMLYASLSGIHYKTCEFVARNHSASNSSFLPCLDLLVDRNKRVMIDRRAFDDPDGYLLDPFVPSHLSFRSAGSIFSLPIHNHLFNIETKQSRK